MKKLLCIFLSFILCIGFCGCGESQAEKEQREYERASRELEQTKAEIAEIEREIAELEYFARKIKQSLWLLKIRITRC